MSRSRTILISVVVLSLLQLMDFLAIKSGFGYTRAYVPMSKQVVRCFTLGLFVFIACTSTNSTRIYAAFTIAAIISLIFETIVYGYVIDYIYMEAPFVDYIIANPADLVVLPFIPLTFAKYYLSKTATE